MKKLSFLAKGRIFYRNAYLSASENSFYRRGIVSTFSFANLLRITAEASFAGILPAHQMLRIFPAASRRKIPLRHEEKLYVLCAMPRTIIIATFRIYPKPTATIRNF